MPELMRTGGSPLSRYEQRSSGRAVARTQANTEVALAKVESQALQQVAKAQAVGYVGQQAMQTVALVSQMEQQLGQACPLAVTRLQGIADMTALSVAQVVADTARKLG